MPLNSRNNPNPNLPYATCSSCGIELPTKAEADQHMNETVAPVSDKSGVIARGHRVSITNQTREGRVQAQINSILERAVEDNPGIIDTQCWEIEITDEAVEQATEELLAAVERGDVAYSEVTRVLKRQPQFIEAWREALPDSLVAAEGQQPLFDLESNQ